MTCRNIRLNHCAEEPVSSKLMWLGYVGGIELYPNISRNNMPGI